MQIPNGASVAVVVNRAWANLHGVKIFLRRHDDIQTDLRGVDESYVLFASVLDAEDARGVWIEMQTEKHTEGPDLDRFRMLIPWSQVLTIVLADQFSPAIRQEARRIGFTREIERE